MVVEGSLGPRGRTARPERPPRRAPESFGQVQALRHTWTMDRKFIQISTVVVNGRVVIYGLDGVGRVWKMVDGEESWAQLPFRRQGEPK